MKTGASSTGLHDVSGVLTRIFGLYFPAERWDILARNLANAAPGFGFSNIDDFLEWVKSASLSKQEIELLASYITISETYFWREPQTFSALTSHILPDLICSRKNGNKTIRIWSAGCSTGEEAYSLAIAIHNELKTLEGWNISILGSDINPKSLQKAMKGIYSKWSFRNCPSWIKSKYFRPVEDGNFQVIPEIRDMVRFNSLNLAGDSFPSSATDTNDMDVIFCRNVLMYFSEEWLNGVSQKLFHSLNQDGWFVVSSCELSSQVFSQFVPVHFPEAIVYRKGNKEFLSSARLFKEVFNREVPFPVVTEPPVMPEPVIHSFIPETDHSFSHKITKVAPVIEKPSTDHAIDPLPETVADTAFRVRQMANQGNLPEALALCNEGVAADKLDTGLYFLRASILQELDKTDEAIASLKQAIYLEPNFSMGHFALGNLYVRQGKPKNAKKYFNNVLDLLRTCSDGDILPESDGLSVKYIREIILANMQKHKII